MPKHQRPLPDIYKIVYVGPVGSGKRTNLQQIEKLFDGTPGVTPGEVVVPGAVHLSLPAADNFDKPLSVHTMNVEPSSPLWLSVLRGVNGVVFVSDSQQARYEDNLKAMTEVIGKLAYYRLKIEAFPFVIQYNKRDVDGAVSLPRLEDELNPLGLAAFNAVASEGTGVAQTLKAINFLVEKYNKR